MKILFLFALFFTTILGCKATGTNNKNGTNLLIQKKGNNLMNDSTQAPDSIIVATIETNMGNIEIQLFPKEAPKTVENFIGLSKEGYYNGVIFHRVIAGFMIQGGDPTGTGRGGESIWGGKFNDEISPNLKFDSSGIVAMANAGPNTNGSQFFITVAPTTWLNGHYSIFGKVIGGMDVVYAIDKVKTNKQDRPINKVIMEKVIIKSHAN